MPGRLSSLFSLGVARAVAPELIYRPRSADDSYDLDYNGYSERIQGAILQDGPFLGARLGSVEALACLSQIWEQGVAPLRAACARAYLRQLRFHLSNNAGVFPASDEQFQLFCQEYLASMASIDVLASWMQQEDLLTDYLAQPKTAFLEDIVPFVGSNPWSAALAGRRVLVVHPFKQSIESQYAQRELLFADPQVLPQFDLVMYPAVQSMGGRITNSCVTTSGAKYANWTEALAAMKDDIAALDFDVAILGCGAYGLPLAAHIKALGKPAIHLGGVTQCLFGIKGRRWEEDYGWDKLYFNEHWVYPHESERPKNAESVENACYWGDESAGHDLRKR